MNRAKAIEAASRAAEAVWACGRGKGQPAHLVALFGRASYRQLAEWVEANSSAPAEAVYIQHTETPRTAWAELAPVVRVAVEVFRATTLILLVEVRALEAAHPAESMPAAPPPDRGMTRRYFRQRPSFGARVNYGKRK